jgi:hypothetical protein
MSTTHLTHACWLQYVHDVCVLGPLVQDWLPRRGWDDGRGRRFLQWIKARRRALLARHARERAGGAPCPGHVLRPLPARAESGDGAAALAEEPGKAGRGPGRWPRAPSRASSGGKGDAVDAESAGTQPESREVLGVRWEEGGGADPGPPDSGAPPGAPGAPEAEGAEGAEGRAV